jgi:peptidoglycan/xylan/chitin deacetylase (PgdA/CDA1 family)
MNKVTVTTSWDDGHILDVKLSELLKKYNLKGTFYIAPKNREFN